jgi:Alpha amylase, catalytic domain
MSKWPRYPVLYEINTWVWLNELRRKHQTLLDLGSVPAAEWDSLAQFGFDAVWLMGVWERSPAGIAIANRNRSLLEDFQRALSDFRPEDNVGSPYCVRRYVVDQQLGGPRGLATAREELRKRGMRLILDFVPNHVATDHPWIRDHPEFFISGTADDVKRDPSAYIVIGTHILACGRDPYFPPWPDVVQLNAFDPGLRQAVVEAVSDIASQCDGVRCDMSMLLLNTIFERTWKERAGAQPTTEYWDELTAPTKKAFPSFVFIAEAYWDLEWELQQHGFDFCYDKRLYDRLRHENTESIRLHLAADLSYQGKLVRFLENHDECRAAAAFPSPKERAAAVVFATLPGAKLFHEGQFAGRKIRLPVFLGRLPQEPEDEALRSFYQNLIRSLAPVFREGEWRFCPCNGWPDNQSCLNLLAWTWQQGQERYVIVVNFSDAPAQGRVQLPWPNLGGQAWQLSDTLSGATYDRDGQEMLNPGLYVSLSPWNYHCFAVQSLAAIPSQNRDQPPAPPPRTVLHVLESTDSEGPSKSVARR